MKQLVSTLLVFFVLLSLAPALSAADQYVGVSKCAMCHKKRHESHVNKYMAGKHYHSFKTLKGDEQKKADCLSCHTTGYGKGGYEVKDDAFWNPAADDKAGARAVKQMADLQRVSCEMCHVDLVNKDNYKSHSKKDGYQALAPTAETCKSCHNEKSPTHKPINFTEEIKKLK
jgi:hypothetical protein